MSKSIAFVFILSIAFVGCKSAMLEKGTIYGMIYDENNEPVSAASIKIGNDIELSDFYGHFCFDLKFKESEYVAEISKPGFISKAISFHAGNSSQLMHVKMESCLSAVNSCVSYLDKGEMEKCISKLEHINGIDSNEQLVFIRAIAYYKLGEFEKAYADLKSIRNFENNSYVNSLLEMIKESLVENEQ